jgi:hypothetical protein
MAGRPPQVSRERTILERTTGPQFSRLTKLENLQQPGVLVPFTEPVEELLNSKLQYNPTSQGYQHSQYSACKRFVSDCRHQKAILLLHAVGSGKTITSLCMTFNLHPSIETTVLTIRGLESAFNDEISKMNDFYTSAESESRFKNMRVVFYDELAASLLAMSAMRPQDLSKAILRLYNNKFLIIDEAHKLLHILKNDSSGRSEKMLNYIFSACAKIAFLTATPVQSDWSDFGKLMKMIIKANEPTRLTSLRVYNEIAYKKEFWFPNDSSGLAPVIKKPWWWLTNMGYTLIFVKGRDWLKAISELKNNMLMKASRGAASGVEWIAGWAPALQSVLSAIGLAGAAQGAHAGVGAAVVVDSTSPGWLRRKWDSIPPSAKNALKITAITVTIVGVTILAAPYVIAAGGAAMGALMSVPGVATVGAAAGKWMAFAGTAYMVLDTIKSIAGAFDGKDIYPMDITEMTMLFSPYISFNDYKATEMIHKLTMNEFIKMFPLLEEKPGIAERLMFWRTHEPKPPAPSLMENYNRLRTSEPENAIIQKIKACENILARFPVLNITTVKVPYSPEQKLLNYMHYSKGYVHTMGELNNVARVKSEFKYNPSNPDESSFTYFDTTLIRGEEKYKLHSALRSIGNFSFDCNCYIPIQVSDYIKTSGLNQVEKQSMQHFAENGCFMPLKIPLSLMKQIHGKNAGESYFTNYQKIINELKDERGVFKTLFDKAMKQKPNDIITSLNPNIYSCPKFEKALQFITDARKKFVYLPVVYSNFENQGLNRFSAFLTNKGLNHFILTPNVLAENPTFVSEMTQKPFLRWATSPNNVSKINTRTHIIDNKIDNFLNENVIIGEAVPKREQQKADRISTIKNMIYNSIYNQPCCILVDPTLQEGLSLVLNEVMICLEPMTGFGNQEQVYGRVVRSYSPSEKQKCENAYDIYTNEAVKKPSVDAQGISVAYAELKHFVPYAKLVIQESEKIKTFTNTSDYSALHYVKDNIAEPGDKYKYRPVKYMFQLHSSSFPSVDAKTDDYLTIDLRSGFTNFLSMCSVDVDEAFVKALLAAIPENIATPLYKREKAVEITESITNPLLKIRFLQYLWNIAPHIAYGLNYHTFIPYVMFDAVIQEYKVSLKSASRNEENPQYASHVASKGTIETDGFYTSDEFWLAKNYTQELEYDEMRVQLNKFEDDNISELYPASSKFRSETNPGGRIDHFSGDRQMCSPTGNESIKYYPRGKQTRKCVVKTKSQKGTSSCDLIGPYAIQPSRKPGQVVINNNVNNNVSDPGSVGSMGGYFTRKSKKYMKRTLKRRLKKQRTFKKRGGNQQYQGVGSQTQQQVGPYQPLPIAKIGPGRMYGYNHSYQSQQPHVWGQGRSLVGPSPAFVQPLAGPVINAPAPAFVQAQSNVMGQGTVLGGPNYTKNDSYNETKYVTEMPDVMTEFQKFDQKTQQQVIEATNLMLNWDNVMEELSICEESCASDRVHIMTEFAKVIAGLSDAQIIEKLGRISQEANVTYQSNLVKTNKSIANLNMEIISVQKTPFSDMDEVQNVNHNALASNLRRNNAIFSNANVHQFMHGEKPWANFAVNR